MERVILATLRWDTAAVTPQDFLPLFLSTLEERGGGGGSDGELLSTLRRHSDTLAAMCACDSRFLGAPPSLVAAASLNCALRGLGDKGPTQLLLLGEALTELCQTDLVGNLLKRKRKLFYLQKVVLYSALFSSSLLKISIFLSCMTGGAAVLQRHDRMCPATAAEEGASAGALREG